MTERLKASRIAIIEGALISAAKCAEAAGKRATWRELAKAVDDDLTRPPPEADACAPLQPATGFINAIADRFQEAHLTPLSRDKALLLALTALAEAEADLGPLNDPKFDWSLDGARVIADENIEHWERPSDHA